MYDYKLAQSVMRMVIYTQLKYYCYHSAIVIIFYMSTQSDPIMQKWQKATFSTNVMSLSYIIIPMITIHIYFPRQRPID